MVDFDLEVNDGLVESDFNANATLSELPEIETFGFNDVYDEVNNFDSTVYFD